MKHFEFVLAALVAVVAVSCCPSKDVPLKRAIDPSLAEEYDKVFTDVRCTGTNEIHSMVVVKDGKVVYERYAPGQEPDYYHILWSASKTFTATAVGFAVQDGLLSVEDKVLSFFEEDEKPVVEDSLQRAWLESMTVHDLLVMSSGFKYDLIAKTEAGVVEFPSRQTLAMPLDFEPGTAFRYNSMNTYLLSAIVTKLTGKTAEQYMDEKFFKPLGIRKHLWEVSTEGYSMGGWGLHITTESLAKAGLFFLQRGKWNGKQLLSESWFDEAMSVQIETSHQRDGSEWRYGYGYQMWHCSREDVYRFDGAFGQFSFIMPEINTVVAVNCHTKDAGSAIAAVLNHVK